MRIAVFLTNENREYVVHLYEGFSRYMQEHKITIHMFFCFTQADQEESYGMAQYGFLEFPDLDEYDGIIIPMITFMDKNAHQWLLLHIQKYRKICVMIDEEIEGYPYIGIDQYRAMMELTEHMIYVHGAENFCYLGGIHGTYEADIRKRGFLDTLKKQGKKIRPEWIFDGTYSYEDGKKLGKRFIKEYEDGKMVPDTIICANDEMAIGAYDAFFDSQLQGKIRVSGFDWYQKGMRYSPTLTSVARPKWTIAYESCSLLEKLLVNTGKADVKKILPYELIYGDTCGCHRNWGMKESEYRRTVFHERLEREIYEEKIRIMEKRIINNIPKQKILEAVKALLIEFGCNRGSIILADDLLEDKPRIYRECLNTAIAWNYFAENVVHGKPLVYLPLHYEKRVMGYVWLEGADKLLQFDLLESFYRTICFSLENYIQKRQYYALYQKYQNLYVTDQLTGIYNRFGLHSYGKELFDKNYFNRKSTLVVFCDINCLKHINDTFGHEAGDWAIQAVGSVLRNLQSENCIPFRYGGDEFIIIAAAEHETDLIQRIKNGIHEKSKEQDKFMLEISIGSIVTSKEQKKELEHYLTMADEIMYQEKKRYHSKK